MSITIFHNPRCGKPRQALALLNDCGVRPRVLEYLRHPPTAEELRDILDLLQMEPRQLMRQREPEYKHPQLDNPALSNEELVRAMIEHPILVERPMVSGNGKAAVGRPPENVKEIP